MELQIIIGKSPWRVWKGIGSFMLFEFGRPRRNKDGSRSGTYTLWIYMAEWRIHKARRELAHSESPDETIHRAAEGLTRKKLEAVFLTTFVAKRHLRYGAAFHFEGGYRLRAWAYERHKDDEDIFFLYSPAACISYRRDGTLTSEPINRK